MSWKTINSILGRASIDPGFWRAFQQNPLATLERENIELTTEEQEIFIKLAHLPFQEFCKQILAELGPNESS
jgi:hypothetical protein